MEPKEKIHPGVLSVEGERVAQIFNAEELSDFFENATVMLHCVNTEGKNRYSINFFASSQQSAYWYAVEEKI